MPSCVWETPFGRIQIHEELAQQLVEGFEFNVGTAKGWDKLVHE